MRMIIFIALLAIHLPCLAANDSTLLVGTYTHQGSHGIYVIHFDPATGALTLKDSIAAVNPSFLTVTADARKIFAVEETEEGYTSVFDFDPVLGKGKMLHRESTLGAHPCFIDLHNSGKWVAVANYSGGSLNILSAASDHIKDINQVIQFQGRGAHATRQTKPHVHQAVFSHGGRYLWVTDLGLDKVIRYNFYPKREKPADPTTALTIELAPGMGPRHVAVHPRLPIAYVLGELDGMIRVIEHTKKGYSVVQTMLSDTVSRQPGSAHIVLSSDNRFLYVSHRADANLISIYEVHPRAGVIRSAGAVSTGGIAPRNFTLHPSGKWLLVANQQSNEIKVFSRDPQTGLLEPTEYSLQISLPVCLRFLGS